MDDGSAPAVVRAIVARRTVRDFAAPAPVSADVLDQILACGLAAPSSRAAQPWRFHVVEDRAALAAFAQAMRTGHEVDTFMPHDPQSRTPQPQYRSTVRESADVLARGSAAIFIENRAPFSGGRRQLAESAGPLLVGHGLELIGIGAAVENMWLAAEASGLGVAFLGDVAIADADIDARLGITGDLVGVLVLGMPRHERTSRQAKDPRTSEFVCWYDSSRTANLAPGSH